jgi:SAM-dependent methyltransferase
VAVADSEPPSHTGCWGPLGRALLDYHHGRHDARIVVHSSLWEDEVTPVEEFYRPEGSDLPDIEQRALRLCQGRVLDLGAGAGRHALELQRRGFDVTAIDVLPEAVRIMRDRGVKDARHGDLTAVSNERFETVLLMMHGLGLVGTTSGLIDFLDTVRSVLADRGRILCDSADLAAVLPNRAAAHRRRHGNDRAFGEVRFRLSYGSFVGEPYPWLFIDARALARAAEVTGFRCSVAARGDRGAYLARMQRL